MLNIAIFGAPGVGKGTQSTKIVEKYNLVHLSTGDMLREETKGQTELGIKAKAYMDKGDLLPDSLIIDMIAKKVEANKQSAGIIYDGFPRTVKQAEALDQMLESKGLKLSCMLYLEADHDTLVQRILNRGKESGRADDQNEATIENRINNYNAQTLPVADYYAAQGKSVKINGIGELDVIFEEICKAIDACK